MGEPHESNDPLVIVGVSRDQAERSFHLGKKHQIDVPQHAKLVVVDAHLPQRDPLLAPLIGRKQLAPGVILVRSPFQTARYAEESEAELAFEYEKIQLVSQLCQLLGAVQVASKSSSLRVEEKSISVKAAVGKKVGRANVFSGKTDAEVSQTDRWEQMLEVNDAYGGGEPDLQAAERFVREHKLNEPMIMSLVAARGAQNPIHERTVTVTYEGAQDHNLTIASKVVLPQVSIDGAVRRRRSTRRRVSLALHIEFPRS